MSASDREVLLALYRATGGLQWKHNGGWNTDADISSWYGVKVRDGRVVGLTLSYNNLQGSIPKELGQLTSLTSLDFSYNRLGDQCESNKVFDFMNKGFRLRHYRYAAAGLSDLSRNSAHRVPLQVDGQAGRPEGKGATKRKASNGEYNTSSRYNGIQRASRTSWAGSVPAAAPSDDGGNSNSPILSQSSSIPQGSTSGASNDIS